MQRVLFALVVVFLLSACGGAAATPSGLSETGQPPAQATVIVDTQTEGTLDAGEAMTDTGTAAEPTAEPAEASASEEGEAPANGEAAQIPDNGRKIVYNAAMTLQVDDPRQVSNALYGIATKYGGFVSDGNVYEFGKDNDGNPIYRADVQLRVEASNFNLAQEELRGLADAVLSEKVDTQDVTGEFVDVESRVRNLKRLEEEMQVLLTDARARAGEMEDILTIYRELTSIRAEIEQYQGRLNVLSDLVGLATINVTLVAPEPAPLASPTPTATPTPVPQAPWSASDTTREAYDAFVVDLQGVTDATIWFIFTGLPRLIINLVILLIVIVIARRIWFRVLPYVMSRAESQVAETQTPPPPPPVATPPSSAEQPQ